MPSKKKTNYISYEIKKLEKYFKQLEKYMDDNPPDSAEDRVEMMESTRGNPIMKVIATKEQQIKLFKETLKELPTLLEQLNKLRMTVDDEVQEDEVRGGHGVPGFMRKKGTGQPVTNKKVEEVEINEEFDDDPIEDDIKQNATEEYEYKLLLPGPDEEPEEDEESDPWEEED